ncbi:MAG: hypothetical protein IT179_22060 [Acidobacteria bacterium]|nr:hypothetical protein [Acidobacteriota bacterium]
MSPQAWLAVAGLVLALVLGPVVLARHVNSPGLGPRLLLVMAVLLPIEFVLGATAFSLCFLYTAFVLVVWLLRQMIVERRVLVDSSPVVVATLFFIAAASLSFLVGLYPWFPIDGAPLRAQLGGLAIFILSGGVLLVVAHETRTLSQLRGLTFLFIGVGAVSLLAMFIPPSEITFGRLKVLSHGTVGSLFFTWLVAMSVSQAIWNRSLSGRMRALLLAVAAAVLARGLFLTFDWASGWMPPIIALGILLLFRFPRLTISGSLLLAVPAIVASGAAWESLMKGESWSWLTRVEAQRVLQQVIAREPLFGLGPANYHFYTYLFPILGYRIRFNSHNNFTDFLAQVGLVGLLVFCWFAFETLSLAYRLHRRAPDDFSRAYAVGTFSGVASSLAAGMLADWIVPFVYNIGILGFRSSMLFWFFVGGLAAMKRLDVARLVPTVRERPPRVAAARVAATIGGRARPPAPAAALRDGSVGLRCLVQKPSPRPVAVVSETADGPELDGEAPIEPLRALFAKGGLVEELGKGNADSSRTLALKGASAATRREDS